MPTRTMPTDAMPAHPVRIRIKNWTARRSGAAITVTGVDAEDGTPVALGGIARIEAGAAFGPPVAVDLHGQRFELL
jgi:hypothetical protein